MTAISSKMMEFEGRTLEDAIRSACNYFKTEESSLDIQVLSKASTGIFGLGGKKFRILATLKTSKDSIDKQEKRDGETNQELKNEITEKIQDENLDDLMKRYEDTSSNDSLLDAYELSEEKEEDILLREFEDDEEEDEIELTHVSEEEIKSYLNEMKVFLDKIFELARLDVTTAIKHDEKGGFIDISGNDIHLVIGRDGTNLDAIYYLINRVLKNRTNKNITIRVDADGYNRKHELRIIEIAERLAKRAKQTGKTMLLSPLSPRDRRLVHMHLKIVGGVRTTSIGEGIYKKIMIVPNRPRFKSENKRQHEKDSYNPMKKQSYGRENRDRRDMRGNYQKPHRSSRYKKSP